MRQRIMAELHHEGHHDLSLNNGLRYNNSTCLQRILVNSEAIFRSGFEVHTVDRHVKSVTENLGYDEHFFNPLGVRSMRSSL